jgi:Ca-activated chloride channel family protein
VSFGAPGYLLLLLLAGASAACVGWWLVWRARARTRLGWRTAGTSAAVLGAPALLLAALTLAVVAAARPQAGSHDVLVEQRGVDLVIVLDVSNSMLAGDVPPTRLGQAQTEIARLLDRMEGNRAGLVIFAGRPFVRSPLTADLPALGTIVAGVDRERALVAPGSDLGAAIRGAQALLDGDETATKALLVVSDGEDHGAGVGSAVADAQRAGIRVYAAGAGTVQGAPVRDVDPITGIPRDRIDAAGSPVVTRMDEAALRAIASAGGGRYISLAGGSPPLSGLAAEFKGLTQTAFGAKQSSQPVERFQIVAALALALLIAPLVWPLLRRPRAALHSVSRLWPLAGAGLLVGAICSSTVADINRHGNNEYAREDFAAALVQYRTAEAKAPGTGELFHNAGNALDRSGEYENAIEETKRALPARPGLLPLIEYALGNHYAGALRLGDASDAYKRALLADPADADAKHNLEVVTARQTPSPAPTPPPGQERTTPEATATAGEGSTPVGGPSGTPGPSRTGVADGSPTPGAGALTQEQLDRTLAEALAGKDKQFTQDEAIRVLDLLDETNRRAIENLGSGRNPGSLPDY